MAIQNVVIPSNLGVEFDIGVEVANKISVKVDGTSIIKTAGVLSSVSGGISADPLQILTLGTDGKPYFSAAAVKANETVTTLVYDALTKIFTYTNEAGAVANYDLSSLAIDINVTGGSYDATTGVLTLVQDDGGPTITVNLQDLKVVVTGNSTSVALTGTGEAATPLVATAIVSPAPGNQLLSTGAGLYALSAVASETPFAPTSASNSVTFVAGGVNGHSPDLAVNLLVVLPTEVQDAFGVHLGQMGL